MFVVSILSPHIMADARFLYPLGHNFDHDTPTRYSATNVSKRTREIECFVPFSDSYSFAARLILVATGLVLRCHPTRTREHPTRTREHPTRAMQQYA